MKLKTKLNELISELKKEIIAGNYEVLKMREYTSIIEFPDGAEIEMWTSNGKDCFAPYTGGLDFHVFGERRHWLGENREKAWKVYQSKIEPLQKSIRENKIKELYNQINKLENENGNI